MRLGANISHVPIIGLITAANAEWKALCVGVWSLC